MLKVAICDDEQKDIDIAEKCILEYSFKHNLDIECANYRTGQELLDKMESGEHYDFLSLMWKWRRRMEYISPQLSEKDTTKMQLSFL